MLDAGDRLPPMLFSYSSSAFEPDADGVVEGYRRPLPLLLVSSNIASGSALLPSDCGALSDVGGGSWTAGLGAPGTGSTA